jgi:hypothetical protein
MFARLLTSLTIPSTVTSMSEYDLKYSGVKTVNYCGNNASVLEAIAVVGLSPTCISPATTP